MYEANEGNFNVKSSVAQAHAQDYCRCCLRPLNAGSRQKIEAVLRSSKPWLKMETVGSFRCLAVIRTPLDLKMNLYQVSIFCPPGSNMTTCQIERSYTPWNKKEKIQQGPNIIYLEKKCFPCRFYCKYLTEWPFVQCLKAVSAVSIINCCLMVAVTFDMQLRVTMEVASCSSWLLSFWRISWVLSQPFLTSTNTSLAFICCNKGGYPLLCLAVAVLALHKHIQQLGVSLNPGVAAAAPSVKESVETDATG